jgi:hypothetical protein
LAELAVGIMYDFFCPETAPPNLFELEWDRGILRGLILFEEEPPPLDFTALLLRLEVGVGAMGSKNDDFPFPAPKRDPRGFVLFASKLGRNRFRMRSPELEMIPLFLASWIMDERRFALKI